MTTLLKAYLRKTEDPLEMYEILLQEYYPTIIKASGKDFVTAILESGDLGTDKETIEAFKKLRDVKGKNKVGQWMHKDNPPFLLETIRDNDGYEEEARLNNLMKFRNLLEKERNWNPKKYGDLGKIISGLNVLIKKEENRLKGATKRKTTIFEEEQSGKSGEKVVNISQNLKDDLKILTKLETKLTKFDIYDFEGQLVYDKDIENPLKELIPDNKALKNLEDAARPDYYLKLLTKDEVTGKLEKVLNAEVRKEFEKELKRDFERLSKPSAKERFPLERFKRTAGYKEVLEEGHRGKTRQEKDIFSGYAKEQEKNFKPFKEEWIKENIDSLYTDGESVVRRLNDEGKALNNLKQKINEKLTAENSYQELDGKTVKKTLLDALLYAIEQERGVILERAEGNKRKFMSDYNALKHLFNEGGLREALELERVSIFIAPPIGTDEDQWKLLQNNVEEYLKQEFDNVQLFNRDSDSFGGQTLVKKAEFQFLEPAEGFNDEEFLKHFKNTFGDRVMAETEMTQLEEELEEIGGEEE